MNSDRGVSDVIGFVLVFSLIISSVAVVSVTAFTALEDARELERRENVEKAFIVMEDNIMDVVTGEAPARETEVKVGDSTLYMGDETQINVTVTNISSTRYKPFNNTGQGFSTSPIIYETPSGTQVVYEGGAVIRNVNGESTIVHDPLFYSEVIGTDKVMFISVPRLLTVSREGAVSGGTRLVRTREISSYDAQVIDVVDGKETAESNRTSPPGMPNYVIEPDPTYTVTVEINNTQYSEAWQDYCEESSAFDTAIIIGDDKVECQGTFYDRVVVRTRLIGVRLN